MQIHFLRHATLIVRLGGLNILVDPMLSPAGAMEPVANAVNQERIPLVDLPVSEAELDALIASLDAVLVTHTHRDHWDAQAVARLPKALPILTQSSSVATIEKDGFANYIRLTGVTDNMIWRDIAFMRIGGQHGTGEIGQKMGEVSGFVIQAPNEPSLYIAGDTIWCPEVEQALNTHRPDVVILNAGAAQFLTGDPITMTAQDVLQVCRTAPQATIIAVHMEAINHCLLTRSALHEDVKKAGFAVQIPANGEIINI